MTLEKLCKKVTKQNEKAAFGAVILVLGYLAVKGIIYLIGLT